MKKSDKIFLWLLTPFLFVWVCLLVFIDTFVNPMWDDNKGVAAPPPRFRLSLLCNALLRKEIKPKVLTVRLQSHNA